jgi:hypothetical protein
MREKLVTDALVKRRTFLGIATLAPAVAAAALLATRRPPDKVPLARPDDGSASVGYHETEHVRTYYRCAGYL